MDIDVDEEEKTITKQLERLNQEFNYSKLIGGIISIIIGLGISFELDLLYMWIPASFFLMFLWSGYSGVSMIKRIRGDKLNKNLMIVKQLKKQYKIYVVELLLKNSKALLEAITLIFCSNIFIILLHLSGKVAIPFNRTFEIALITLVSIYFSIVIFLIDKIVVYFDKKVLPTIQSLKQITTTMKLVVTIFLILTIGIPGYTFYLTVNSVKNWWFLIVVLLIQIIIIILLYSFFSVQQIKSELHKALNNMQKIREGIISRESLPEIVKFSRYEIDETFKLIQIFLFRPHPAYLEKVIIPKHKSKRKR
ncbi:MAG TPA: hypothetical protein ENI49_07200 [Thermoplasmatales archaeon]|nr:hypothetical protein [Thermoplasmatales archaeon]